MYTLNNDNIADRELGGGMTTSAAYFKIPKRLMVTELWRILSFISVTNNAGSRLDERVYLLLIRATSNYT
jgi:hypothetical protein